MATLIQRSASSASLNVRIGLVIVAGLLAFSCNSRNKNTDTVSTTPLTGAGSEGVDSTPMSFDAQGSDSGKIDGLATVWFGYDKATLDGAAKEQLRANAAWMKSNTKSKIQIEGHCDSRGSIEYNLALGERRAKAVRDYMIAQGIPASRLSTISYGKERPLVQSESEDAWAKNRRANFVPSM